MVGRSAERTPRRAWRWRLSSSSRWRCSCRPRPRGDGARLLALFLGDHLVYEAVGLLEVLDPVLRVVAAGVLDDAALAEVEAVGLDELDGLDLEPGVVVRRDGVVFAHGATGKIKTASRRVPRPCSANVARRGYLFGGRSRLRFGLLGHLPPLGGGV
jgi:hypothetical protein